MAASMVDGMRYHRLMWRIAPISVLFAALLVAASAAQSVNWGPSVTSMGFGGSNRLGAVPPSVTSLGFGRMGNPGFGAHHPQFFQPVAPAPFNSRHHRPYRPAWGGYYYYPYPIFDYGEDYENNSQPPVAENQDEYLGGPTIFDRRGNGQYPPPGTTHTSEPAHEPMEANSSPAPQPAAEVANQPETVLVFKDGHQANVANYAIVGSTLYDFAGGMRHKIALADLDLKATAQQNDDRGVDFEVPAGSTSN
ncbi:MAG: hypothetical protein ACRD2U_14370 [Terriglobales bacterium]